MPEYTKDIVLIDRLFAGQHTGLTAIAVFEYEESETVNGVNEFIEVKSLTIAIDRPFSAEVDIWDSLTPKQQITVADYVVKGIKEDDNIDPFYVGDEDYYE